MYALESVGSDPPSGKPSLISESGIAIITKTEIVAARASQGFLVAQTGALEVLTVAAFLRLAGVEMLARSFLVRMRSPIKDSAAGVTVSAISTATTMAMAPIDPIKPTKPIPVRFNATSAMTTVTPANSTAFPLVPFAIAIDSLSFAPDFSCLR